MIVMDETTCMVRVLERISRFYMAESCGQCTPCREGTGWLTRMLRRILAGQGRYSDLDLLVQVANQIEGHTICALGDAAAWPVQSFLRHFRARIRLHDRARREEHRRCARAGGGMSDDVVNIEVDGRPLKARKGQMVIQLTDPAGIYVPRFCYHEKLSIAANCRMCLVEVEKAPKPMPACATPVTEGMKVFTRSPRALAAQKATMEFLLINHPLDCPICDQGGECELQDLALGFGSAKSRFDERKRVVKDKNLGPLISTDMTRCIHCTRCVRFTAEIAGMQELGATGRGEDMEIGTFIEKSVDHELSGNVIDLCPVGALNSKPFRHRARSWEMTEHALVSPHDGAGTNLWGHVLRGRLMRVVPRTNEEINETWIADRDRFSYEGIYAADRLREPMMRVGGPLAGSDVGSRARGSGRRCCVRRSRKAGQGASVSSRRPAPRARKCYLLGPPRARARLAQRRFAPAPARFLATRRAIRHIPGSASPCAPSTASRGCCWWAATCASEAPIVAHRVRKAALAGCKVSVLSTTAQAISFPAVAADGQRTAGGPLPRRSPRSPAAPAAA